MQLHTGVTVARTVFPPSEWLRQSQPSGGGGGGETKPEDHRFRQHVALGEHWSDPEEQPESELHLPPMLAHWRLLEHGKADQENQQQRDAVQDRRALLAGTATEYGSERGEQGEGTDEVEDFEKVRIHGAKRLGAVSPAVGPTQANAEAGLILNRELASCAWIEA